MTQSSTYARASVPKSRAPSLSMSDGSLQERLTEAVEPNIITLDV